MSGAHGTFGGWIYRVNRSWEQLLSQLHEGGHKGAAIFTGFFNWYAPFFAAYSFALRRQNEYEADRDAARLVGAPILADTLSSLPVKAEFLDETYWRSIYKNVQHQPQPPCAPFSQLIQAFNAGITRETARETLDRALSEKTGTSDTHPSLSDRLRALGQEARLPEPVVETAAARFFGPSLPRLSETLDARWRQSVAEQWQQQHEHAREARENLRVLDEKAQTSALTVEEAWQRADWTEDFVGPEAAVPLLHEVLARDDSHAPAHFALGRILLARNEADGVAHIEKAITLDHEATLPGLEFVYAFQKKQRNEEAAKAIYERVVGYIEKRDAAGEERASIPFKARYLPHGLSQDECAALVAQLEAHDAVNEAYLVRKEVAHFPEDPPFVLGVTIKRALLSLNRDGEMAKLTHALSQNIALPGESFVIVLEGENKRLLKIFKRIPDALIHRRR